MVKKITVVITFCLLQMLDNVFELFPNDVTICSFQKNPYNDRIYITGFL